MAKKLKPKVGETYKDAGGRRLRVTAVEIPDRLGREVRGRYKVKNRPMCDYSTTLEIWREVWRDKRQPVDPRTMKIG